MIPLPSNYELQTMTGDELHTLHHKLVEQLSEIDPRDHVYEEIIATLDMIERQLCECLNPKHTL